MSHIEFSLLRDLAIISCPHLYIRISINFFVFAPAFLRFHGNGVGITWHATFGHCAVDGLFMIFAVFILDVIFAYIDLSCLFPLLFNCYFDLIEDCLLTYINVVLEFQHSIINMKLSFFLNFTMAAELRKSCLIVD